MGIKKIIGTSVIAVALIATFLTVSGKASGLFRYIGSDFKASGQVQTVNANSFELVTSGSTWPATMVVNAGTDYSGGYNVFSDVKPGDEVQVVADRSSGDFITLEVKKIPDPSVYGNASCDSFVLSTAVFERPVNDYFYAVKDNMGIKINYDNDTQVIGGTFDDLLPGTEIIVSGVDCRGSATLKAQSITIVENKALEACNSHKPGSIVVRNRTVLLAHDAASAKTPKIDVNLPAGQYKVYGVSFDNHSTSPWDNDANERWKVYGFNGNTQNYTSGVTDDLPNGVDFNETRLDPPTAIGPLTSVQFVHNATPGTQGYQSVYPICVVFEPTGEALGRVRQLNQ